MGNQLLRDRIARRLEPVVGDEGVDVDVMEAGVFAGVAVGGYGCC